jgi:hypothetical protein
MQSTLGPRSASELAEAAVVLRDSIPRANPVLEQRINDVVRGLAAVLPDLSQLDREIAAIAAEVRSLNVGEAQQKQNFIDTAKESGDQLIPGEFVWFQGEPHRVIKVMPAQKKCSRVKLERLDGYVHTANTMYVSKRQPGVGDERWAVIGQARSDLGHHLRMHLASGPEALVEWMEQFLRQEPAPGCVAVLAKLLRTLSDTFKSDPEADRTKMLHLAANMITANQAKCETFILEKLTQLRAEEVPTDSIVNTFNARLARNYDLLLRDVLDAAYRDFFITKKKGDA